MSTNRSSSTSSCLSLFFEMFDSDIKKSFYQKHFKAIEETDEDFELEETEDSDCDILSAVDTRLRNLKQR